MNGFAARYADDGLVVLAIDVREDEGVVDAFARELNRRSRSASTRRAPPRPTWGRVALPVHFWIDADGIVRDGALGGIGPDIMAEGLQTILPGRDGHALAPGRYPREPGDRAGRRPRRSRAARSGTGRARR